VRIVPAQYPPVPFLEGALTPQEADDALALAALFDPVARDLAGRVRAVPEGDRAVGPGAGYVMAPFLYLSPEGGRFNDATFGAYYAAADEATAVAETTFHRARFLGRTAEPPTRVDMRVLTADLALEADDLRGRRAAYPALYAPDPADYAVPQAYARARRAAGADGVVYDSVRHAGGECAAVFRPRLVSGCRAGGHLTYQWDGRAISHVYAVRLRALP
jgi:hypothetical protein